jgi:Trp operon repressor
MLNEVTNSNYLKGQTQLKVWVDEKLKTDFQISCLKRGSNMTAEVEKLLRQYLKSELSDNAG